MSGEVHVCNAKQVDTVFSLKHIFILAGEVAFAEYQNLFLGVHIE